MPYPAKTTYNALGDAPIQAQWPADHAQAEDAKPQAPCTDLEIERVDIEDAVGDSEAIGRALWAFVLTLAPDLG